MKLTKSLKVVLVGVMAATGLAIGGVAMTAGATSTTYYACLASAGTLSHVGTTKPTTAKCPPPNKIISWNSTGPAGRTGPQGPGTPQLSKAQIAQMQWWKDPARSTTYAVGAYPIAAAFDGTNIWVANYLGGSVSKIVVATGVVTTPVTGHGRPIAIIFDGTHLWAADHTSNSITELSTTGAVLHTITGFNVQLAWLSTGPRCGLPTPERTR